MTVEPVYPGLVETAASWFSRMAVEDTSFADTRAFQSWLAADPAHARAYRAHQMTWAELGVVANAGPVLTLRSGALRRVSDTARGYRLGIAWGIASAVLIAAPSALVTQRYWFPSTTYETGPGERLTATLADRSEVTLAPLTRLDVRYWTDERRLTLRQGQAFFHVAHDQRRPFRVTALDRVVTALGTRFQVTIEGGRADVVLIEGSVSVAPKGAFNAASARMLAPGQHISGALATAKIEPADIEAETAWRSGRLVFRDEPLSRVVATLNRYSADRLVLADDSAGAIRVSGSFRYEGAADFAAGLEQSFGLEVTRGDDGIVTISTPGGSPQR